MRFSPKPTVIRPSSIPEESETAEEKVVAPVIFSLTSTTSVNVRKDPDKDSMALGVLYPGTKVDVEEFDKDWYKIVTGEHKGGYVRRPYLK